MNLDVYKYGGEQAYRFRRRLPLIKSSAAYNPLLRIRVLRLWWIFENVGINGLTFHFNFAFNIESKGIAITTAQGFDTGINNVFYWVGAFHKSQFQHFLSFTPLWSIS
uniref:Uncharacterized protein n=1 Tax=Glossina palpalis gambiensis TaxID=67801 RepID=A0A1B0BRT8_9MUSC